MVELLTLEDGEKLGETAFDEHNNTLDANALAIFILTPLI